MNFTTIALAVIAAFTFSAGIHQMHKERALNKSLVSLIPGKTDEVHQKALNKSLVDLIPGKTDEMHKQALNKSLVDLIPGKTDELHQQALNKSLVDLIPGKTDEMHKQALNKSLLSLIPSQTAEASSKFLGKKVSNAINEVLNQVAQDRFLWVANTKGNMTKIDLKTFEQYAHAQRDGFITSLAVSNDKKTLVALGNFGSIDLLDAETGNLIKNVAPQLNSPDGGMLALTQDNKYILKAGYPGGVKQFDFETGKFVFDYGKVFEANESPIKTSAIWTIKATPDSKYFFVANEYGHLKQYDLTTQALVKNYGKVHTDSLSAMTITADGKWLYTTSISGEMKKWNIANRSVEKDFGRIYKKGQDWIFAVTSTADSQQVLVSSSNWTLGLMSAWSVNDDKMSTDFGTVFPANSFRSIMTTSDSKHVFASSDRGLLKMYEISSGKLVKDFGEVFDAEDLSNGIFSMALI